MSHGLQVEEFATAELTALAPSEGAPASDAADAGNGSEVTALLWQPASRGTYVRAALSF